MSPARDMSSSQGSAASASSSSARPPQPVQQLPEPDLELEGELIDADTANTEVPEPGDTQSRLQLALAALCLRHKPSETIEPRLLRVFLDRVVPDAYRIQPKDTLLAVLMHKHFSIPVLTAREAVGKTSPSKHETSYGVQFACLGGFLFVCVSLFHLGPLPRTLFVTCVLCPVSTIKCTLCGSQLMSLNPLITCVHWKDTHTLYVKPQPPAFIRTLFCGVLPHHHRIRRLQSELDCPPPYRGPLFQIFTTRSSM